jgi:hypothetical protein
MDARWIPVLAAALGVLGGVGGAAVGGAVASSGESQRLQEERITEIQDLLIATYAEYQGAADNCAISWGIAAAKFPTEGLEGAELHRQELKQAALVEPQLDELFRTAAAVELIANPQVWDAADKLRDEVSGGDPKDYETLRNSFIRLAREEIEALE